MSDRMRRRRERISEQGMQVIEVIIPKIFLPRFEKFARAIGLSRSEAISQLFCGYYSRPDVNESIDSIILDYERKKKTLSDKHKPEFTDYTLE